MEPVARRKGIGGKVFFTGMVFLSLIPFVRLLTILWQNGRDNLHDDMAYWISPLDQILSGSYHWQNIFHDTFNEGHSNVFPYLIHVLSAVFFDYHIFPILIFGIILTIFKLFFLYDSFTFRIRASSRFILLPIFSFLIFSTSQISVFEHDFPNPAWGLFDFGFFLGIWGLARFSKKWISILLMIVGGIISSWSWGGGPLVWPVFFFGLYIFQVRKRWQYLVLGLGTLFGIWPYVYFLFINPISGLGQESPIFSLINFRIIFQSIGWPFAQNFSPQQAFWRGIVGFVLAVTGIPIVWNLRREIYPKIIAPILMVLLFAALNIYQISIFREFLSPWYARSFMLFWVGLIGFAYVITVFSSKSIFRIWSLLILVTLFFFYVTSNISWRDKSRYLKSRAPVSESCLRNFQTSPTYCEPTLFVTWWGKPNMLYELANPLKRHRLSVFGKRQEWTLQGDYILENVKINENPLVPDIFWSADLSNKAVSFKDYRRLNLFLHSPNSVEWELSLPDQFEKATLYSAIAISKEAPKGSNSDGVEFHIQVKNAEGKTELVFSRYLFSGDRKWQPLSVPLERYRGQKITIIFGSSPGGNFNHDWAMYRFPLVLLEISPILKDKKNYPEKIQPSNTELSERFPSITPQDFIFDINNLSFWKISGMSRVGSKQELSNINWEIEKDPQMEFIIPTKICLANYSHLLVKTSASSEFFPRELKFQYLLGDQKKFTKKQTIHLPLLTDERFHEYSFDLKIIEADKKAYLTGLKIIPMEKTAKSGDRQFRISELRLIKGNNFPYCN